MAKPFLKCPDHWHNATLEPDPTRGLIMRVDSGGTPSTTVSEYWEGDIPWLTPKDISNHTDRILVSSTERMLTRKGLQNSGSKLFPAGTVMLTKRAPVGLVAINAAPMATNQGFLNFECGPLLRPLYLAYWFKANRGYLEMVANGSTYPELYANDLFEFEIAVPTLEVQDAILKVISAEQFIRLIGLPLEQLASTPEQLTEVQKHNRHLRGVYDTLLVKLLSGEIDASRLSPRFLEIEI
jgi:type I restriction enzyme S subunit